MIAHIVRDIQKTPNNLKENTSVAIWQTQKFRVEAARTRGEMLWTLTQYNKVFSN